MAIRGDHPPWTTDVNRGGRKGLYMRPLEERDFRWYAIMEYVPKNMKCITCHKKVLAVKVESANFDEKQNIWVVYEAAEINALAPNPHGFCSVSCYEGWREANPEKIVMTMAELASKE